MSETPKKWFIYSVLENRFCPFRCIEDKCHKRADEDEQTQDMSLINHGSPCAEKDCLYEDCKFVKEGASSIVQERKLYLK